MISTVDYYIIAVYLFVIFWVGLTAGKGLKNIKDYAVANRSFSAPVLFATLSASFIGGGFSFGNADTVFSSGIGVATTLWGFSLMLFLVGWFIAPRTEAFRHCISVGDIVEEKLGLGARVLSGALGTLVCMGVLGAQVGAMGAVFALFTPLTFVEGVLVGCGIVIVYTSVGGMKAVVLTDVIQFLLLVVLIPVTLLFGIEYVGGWDALERRIPEHFLEITHVGFSPLTWLSLFLTFLIGETLVPPYVQRLLIAKSVKATQQGTIWSALLSVPFFLITGLMGLTALAIDPNIPSNLAMPTLISVAAPVVVKGLACAAIISIVMSSADSFLNAASVCLMEDVIKPLRQKAYTFETNAKTDLYLIQFLTLFIGIGSVFLALKIHNVLDVLRFSYNFWAPIMLVSLVMIFMRRQLFPRAFWIGAFVASLSVSLIFMLGKNGKFCGMDAVVIGTAVNAVTIFVLNTFEKHRFRQSLAQVLPEANKTNSASSLTKGK